jgi:hypothetical protein
LNIFIQKIKQYKSAFSDEEEEVVEDVVDDKIENDVQGDQEQTSNQTTTTKDGETRYAVT